MTGLPDAMSIINQETGNRFIVIIDEWDVLIRDEAQNQNIQEAYIGLYGECLRELNLRNIWRWHF